MSDRPDFSTTPRARRPPTWELAALVVAVIALAGVGRAAWVARGEAREARTTLSEARRERDAVQARLQALTARSAAAGEKLAGAAAARAATPTRIVAGVAAVLPADARLERLSIDYGRRVSLEMQVITRDASAWDRLLDRLERAPEFAEVLPGPETREGEVRTVVRARWTGGER